MFSYEYSLDFTTIEEVKIMNEKRYRNKKKYKLLVVFSFFSTRVESISQDS